MTRDFIAVRNAQLHVLGLQFRKSESKLVSQTRGKDVSEMRYKVSEELSRLLKIFNDSKKSDKKETKKVKKAVTEAKKILKTTQDIALQYYGAKAKKVGSVSWARGMDDYPFLVEITKNAAVMNEDLFLQCAANMGMFPRDIIQSSDVEIRDGLLSQNLKQRRKQSKTRHFRLLVSESVMDSIARQALDETEERAKAIKQDNSEED
jgi:hypothetical protein